MRGRRREGRAEGEEGEVVGEGGGEEAVGGDGQRGVRLRRTLFSPRWCFGRVLIPNDTGVRRYPQMKGMKRSTLVEYSTRSDSIVAYTMCTVRVIAHAIAKGPNSIWAQWGLVRELRSFKT